MKRYWLGGLRDHELMQGLDRLVRGHRQESADLLAHLGEVDARRLYAPAGYSSMFTYCVRGLRFSEQEAYLRIRAARLARRWRCIYDAVAEGRLHLTALAKLAPDLTRENAQELLTAAGRKTELGLAALLAERFPQPDLPTLIRVLAPVSSTGEREAVAGGSEALEAESAGALDLALSVDSTSCELGPDRVASAHAAPDSSASVARLTRTEIRPLAPERFALQVTLSRETHDLLAEAQALLGHVVAPGDVAGVLDRARRELVGALRKRRCASVARPREASRTAPADPRHVPAAVRRAVWARDGDRCTFVGSHGHRCGESHGLELDHVIPVARGGTSTLDNLRLRCAGHNQHEAERVFGAGFMKEKREVAGPRTLAAGPARTG